MQTELDNLQLAFAERSLKAIETSQQTILELQETEASWKMLTAKHECERAQDEKLASARTHERLEQQASTILRPTNTMRPELTYEGETWTATFGDLVARGPTPETACQQFDALWLGKEEF